MMKNVFKFIAMAAVAIPLFIGCGPKSKDHVEDADENLTEAGEDLQEAAKDADEEVKAKATADWQEFKDDSERSIAAMEKQAEEIRTKMAKADQRRKTKMSADLAMLEQRLSEQKAKLNQRNAEFENDLNNFNNTVAEKNEEFRREYKHDMEGLANAYNDMLEDNVK